MLGQANTFCITPSTCTIRRQKKHSFKPIAVFMYPSLNRAAKLTFPSDISGLPEDGTIKQN